MELFDRRPGESAPAYEGLRTYFELGADRSLAAVGQKLSKSPTVAKRWSQQWNWVERARAWDDVRGRQRDIAVRNAIEEDAVRGAAEWETRENARQQRMHDTYLRGLNKMDQMLAFPLQSVTTKTVDTPQGEIRQTTVSPARWTFATVYRLATSMFNLGKRATGNEGAPSDDGRERDVDGMIEDYLPENTGDNGGDISSVGGGQAQSDQPVTPELADNEEFFDRRPEESASAYEAARTYFELGPDRSLAAVGQKLSKSQTVVKRWSQQWNWVERARTWDEERYRQLDIAVRKAGAEAVVRVAAEWEIRENVRRERMYDTHLRGLNKMDEMLDFPVAPVTTGTVDTPGGEIRRTRTMPARWTFDTAHRLATSMFNLGKRATGNEGVKATTRRSATSTG